MHLSRRGSAVDGFYVYVAVGQPILVAGAVEAAGELRLTETVGGEKTGVVSLHASGDRLVGEWTGLKGDKAFPIELMPGPPWVTTSVDAPGGWNKGAEACLADPTCSATDASRLFLLADEARAGADCFRFVDGSGTARDLRRGRACLERAVGAVACERGSSGGLWGADLAAMLIDGVGGGQDLPRARALFAGCYDDVTTSWVLERADAKSRDPALAPASICDDNHGTQLVNNECFARRRRNEETRGQLQGKAVAAELDEAGRRLFATATGAYGAYVTAMGGEAYEALREGSMRNVAAAAREESLLRARTVELAAFSRFVAPETSAARVADAERRRGTACAAAPAQTPAEAAARAKATGAWATYRDAEEALYVHAFAPKQGAERVRRALRERLAARRAEDCARQQL